MADYLLADYLADLSAAARSTQAIQAEVKAVKKEAKRSGEPVSDLCPMPPLMMRPGKASESGTFGINMGLVSGTNLLVPSPALLSAPLDSATPDLRSGRDYNGQARRAGSSREL